MAAIEKLLTMGMPHGTDPARALLGAAGIAVRDGDRLDWTDVSQAVAALEPMHRAALYLRVMPDLMSAQELGALVDHLLRHLMRLDEELGTYPRGMSVDEVFGRQAAMIRTVLAEYMDPRTCRRCRGEGTVYDHIVGRGLVKGTCGSCEGQGWRAWSDNLRARRCHVRRADWTGRYDRPYRYTLAECSTVYRAAAERFKQRLFGSAEEGLCRTQVRARR